MGDTARRSVLEAALEAASQDLSVLPIVPGTKRSKIAWKQFQTRRMETAEIRRNFRSQDGLAIVAGKISGNLEILDFDVPDKRGLPKGKRGLAPKYQPFQTLCCLAGRAELLRQLVAVRTPSGGVGLIYRCETLVEPNQKLAERLATQEEIAKNPGERRKVLIETRGEGGYFLTVPTPGYTFLRGSLQEIPTITRRDRELLLGLARRLSECEPTPCRSERSTSTRRGRPGDILNETGTWEEVLEGWTKAWTSNGRTNWCRPGKTKAEGPGATTGNGPRDYLYIHTTNAHPFVAGRAYSKFAAYTFIKHNGNFKAAAKALAESQAQAGQA